MGRYLLFGLMVWVGLVVPLPAVAQDEGETRLILPTVGVDARVVEAGLSGTTWDVSHLGMDVGHLEGTAWLDRPGNVVLGGHSEFPDGRPSVFAALYRLRVGDPILLVQGDGATFRYVVTEIRFVDYTDLSVVYPTDHARLTLVTCALGTFSAALDNYRQRLVVIAMPVG